MNLNSKNYKGKILFVVDHKHRDLPTLSLIGYYLEKQNYQVFYSATGMVMEKFDQINPSVVIIPKPSYSYVNQIKWKLEGRKIIVIEAEGNNQDKLFEYKIIVFPDLYFFWNSEVKSIYEKKFIKNNVKYIVKGFPRSDFFMEPLSNIFNKNSIKSSIGIKNKNKIITIALSTQDTNFSKHRSAEKKEKGIIVRQKNQLITPKILLTEKNLKK